ncbi:C-C motif chemokine 3-like [Scleropages formosus]|uniref:C-C motif chemokine 3-like n=1 Tax=Scleropages formosus TaxID=113540 RepID=A0A8C9SJC2_SCLFO|nr:C-C motif chemokine 3-like [Scleropages formosus]
MKILSAVLLLAMLCSHQLVSGAILPSASNDCCVKFFKGVIPLKKIMSYYKTSSSCPKQAIVMKTDKGQQCVNPEMPWVKRHVASLDRQTTTTTTVKKTTQI